MEKNYECICGFYYSSTDLVDHVEKAHIQVAIHRFVEDIKRVAKLEGLKKFAKELDKPPDLKPKRESRLKSRRKSTKSDDGKTTPSDSTLTDQKDDIKISKNIDKDNKHENDNVDRLSKKEDTISSYLPEDDGITQRIRKSDRSVSSESRDTSIETRRGKKLRKAESNVINKKENEENPVEDVKNVIQENPVEDVKNVIQDRNQITSPILEEELEFLEAFDSFENKTKDSHINRYRCTGCEFSSFEQTLISNHIGKVHKGSDIKPRLQEMRLILEQVVEKKTVDEADITSPRKRRGRPKKSSPLKESSKNPSDQIETENASENSEIKDNHKDLETSNVTETEQNISDQSIFEKSVEAREKHIDDLLNSDDDDELPEMPHEEDSTDNWSPAFGNIELHPVTNSSDEDDSLENTNDNKKNDTNETRNADRPKRSKEKWKVAKAKKSQEDNNTISPISRSTTTDYSLSSRTARELKNLNITFNDTAWSNDNENDASNQQDLETKKSSRKRKVKNKEDALYSLLNYLLDQIMGKDVSQSFLEPINDEIAPGYSEVIKEPMDFSTMEYKLCQHKYQSLSEFIYDFNLVHSNCMIYNPEQSSYYNEGVKLKKFGEDFLSEENLQEIPSYSQLSDVDIGVPFQSEAEINADNQCKNKRSPNKDQKKKTRQPSENDSESDNFPPPFSAVLTISERVKLRQQMGLDLSNISLYKQKKKSKQQSTDNLKETSFEDLSSQPSTSTKESIPVEKEVLKNKENDDTEQREDKTDNETTSIPKANITLTPCDNDDNEDTPSPSPDSALIDAQNLENILTPVKAAENANIPEEGTDKDQDENNSQTSNKQDDNPTRTAKASPWKRKLSVSSENSDQHARTLTPSKSRGILITIVTNDLFYIWREGGGV